MLVKQFYYQQLVPTRSMVFWTKTMGHLDERNSIDPYDVSSQSKHISNQILNVRLIIEVSFPAQ